MNKEAPKTIEVTETLLQDILNYLANKPFVEVNPLIARLQMEAGQSTLKKSVQSKDAEKSKTPKKDDKPSKEKAKA